jgi:hypothetical protein
MKKLNSFCQFISQVFFSLFLFMYFPFHTLAQTPIVESGRSAYKIVVSNPSSTERFAAQELQKYLEKMSGAVLPIINKETSHSFLIGKVFADQNGISLDSKELGFDGYIIKTVGNNIVIAGREQRGTLYAAYAYLEQLGCRWYAPNFQFYGKWGGEYVPRTSTIEFKSFNVVQKPDYKYRREDEGEGWTHTLKDDSLIIDWMSKARMNTFSYSVNRTNAISLRLHPVIWDSVRKKLVPELKRRGLLIEVGGHGYSNFLKPSEYFDEHPDWFGDRNGKRSSSTGVVFNTDNKDAVKEFTSNLLAYLEKHSEIDIFDLWPPDGSRWSNDSASIADGTPTDREAKLFNYVIPRIRKTLPKIKIEFITYGPCLNPPENVKFNSTKLLMDFCPAYRSYSRPLWDKSDRANSTLDSTLKSWLSSSFYSGEVGFYSYYTKYIWRSLPMVIPHLIQKEMAYLHRLGVTGIEDYSEPGNWVTYELNHYVMAEASWNSDVNVDSLVNDLVSNQYGPSSQYIRNYYNLIEATVPQANIVRGNPMISINQIKKYLETLNSCKQLLLEGATDDKKNAQAEMLTHKLQLSLKYALIDLQMREVLIDIASANNKCVNDMAGCITKLGKLYNEMSNLFNDNIDEGVFIHRGRYYFKKLKFQEVKN